MKVFLDTNIVADILFKRPGCLPQENEILARAIQSGLDCYMSALSFPNIVYVSKHYVSDINTTKNNLLKISKFLHVVDLMGRDVVDMINEGWTDYEDSLQYKSAQNCGADYIITRNKKHFISSTIPVLTPVEFCDMIDQES